MLRIFDGLDDRKGEKKDFGTGAQNISPFQKVEERPNSGPGEEVHFGDPADPAASGPAQGPGENIGAGGHWTAEPPERSPNALPPRHGTVALWCAIVALAFALLAELGYSYLVLRKDHISIVEIPATLQAFSGLGARVSAAETNLRELATNWSTLQGRITQLDHQLSSGLRSAGRETQRLVAESEGRMRAEMNQRGQAVDARLTRVESAQTQDQALMAELTHQVASLRSELANSQDSARQVMASLQQHVTRNEEAITDLNQKHQRQRVNFEVARDSQAQLVPGLSLTVLKTDPAYQRFRGYVSLTNEGRTLWLQNVGAQQPLDLFPHDTEHPYSLVITAVNAKGVVGYLLLPARV